MARKVYINGTLYAKEDAVISVFDHGLLYGDGAFEGLRSYAGKVFRIQQHIQRLWDSAKAIWLEIPMTPAAMQRAIEDTLKANGIDDGYIRVIVTRGRGTLGLDPTETSDPQVIIIVDSLALYPDEYYRKGLEVVTVSVARNHPAALDPRIKSLNYLNNILAKIEGLHAGCVEALMLNHNGEVAECTGDNIFVVHEGVLLTPPDNAGILKGVTRGAVIELAADAGLSVRQAALGKHDVYTAEECFLTGTAAEVVPVVKVDSRTIGDGAPGPITRDLMERFRRAARS